MNTARLSAELLAPKGRALPLESIYDHPMQIPGDAAGRFGDQTLHLAENDPDHPEPARSEPAQSEPSRPDPDDSEPDRQEPPEPLQTAHDDARVSCRVRATLYRDLKILAARRQCSVQSVMREALAGYLNRNRSGCECMRGGTCSGNGC